MVERRKLHTRSPAPKGSGANSTQPGSKQLAVQNAKVAHLFHGKTELVQGSLVKRAVGPTWPFGTLLDLCTSRVDVHFSICASEHAAEGQGIG